MNKSELNQKGLRVRHSIPGRMRVRVADIRHNGNRAAALADWVAKQADVAGAEARPVTGSVILFYDPDKVSPSGLLKLLNQWLNDDQVIAPGQEGLRPVTCGLKCPACRPSKPERSLVGRLIGVIALTGYMAYVLVREVIFKSPLSQGPFSLTALVAAAGALPLLKHAWENLRQGRYMSLFPFLAVSCVVA
ncbi:MAG: hypothetical protein J7K15_03960, partial [Deltaproteobacteria bacterium]|nr:hypothetical protein [Deltaproteobacteria bacterium]